MTSLLDIGPLTEEVSVGGKAVHVRGVTPEGFFYLLEKFPAIRTMFGGGVKNVDMAMLQSVAPDCIAHALAVATTDRSKFQVFESWREAVEAAAVVAVNLSAHYQMSLFQAALRLTFPEGIGPFMQGVTLLANSINKVSGVEMSGKAPATTSSKRSRSGFVTDSRGMRLGPGAPSRSSVH
jgi:hypothetical protein